MEPAVLSCIHGYIIHGKVKSLLSVKSPNSVPVTVGSGVGMGWGGGGGEGVVVGGRSERPLHVRGQARTVGGAWFSADTLGQGEREIIYLSLHCHHQNDSCIQMGSDESHFNVSLIVRDKVTRQCPQNTTFEEKGELNWYRTEVLLLTSRTPYR